MIANLSNKFGGFYAGLYQVIVICMLSYIAIIYAHNKHVWRDDHVYQIIDSKDIQDE